MFRPHEAAVAVSLTVGMLPLTGAHVVGVIATGVT